MLPIVEVPESVRCSMARYRSVFCRQEGFNHVCRYVTGLVVSPNKTLQGIYDLQVWEGEKPSRRAMHQAVFEADWDADQLMREHRAGIRGDHGLEVKVQEPKVWKRELASLQGSCQEDYIQDYIQGEEAGHRLLELLK
jgi:hypothetical protein